VRIALHTTLKNRLNYGTKGVTAFTAADINIMQPSPPSPAVKLQPVSRPPRIFDPHGAVRPLDR
jgi:hypothetical protein